MNVAAVLHSKGRGVVTAPPDATLQKIASQLAAKKIGAIVIIGDNGRVTGIISERDVVQAIAREGGAILDQPVSYVMTSDVVTCDETESIDDLMETMTKERFRHLPVVSNGALVGIVSIGDVVKHHVAEVEMEVSAMRCYLATG